MSFCTSLKKKILIMLSIVTFSNYDFWKKKAFSINLTFQVFAGKVDFPHGWV